MKFKPETLGHRVILRPLIERVSKGGIHIARDARSQAINTDRGELIAKGPTCEFGVPNISVGSMVYYAKWGAKTLRNEDQPDTEAPDAFYVICNDEDVLVEYTNE